MDDKVVLNISSETIDRLKSLSCTDGGISISLKLLKLIFELDKNNGSLSDVSDDQIKAMIVNQPLKKALFFSDDEIARRASENPDSFFEIREKDIKKFLPKRKLFHITDTHSSVEDLQLYLKKLLDEFDSENDIIVHTGDLLEDLLDFSDVTKISSFLPEKILEKGMIFGKSAEEFKKYYGYLLTSNNINHNILLEDVLKKNIKDYSSGYEKIMLQIKNMFFGKIPQHMSLQEKKEYMKNYDSFVSLFKKILKNYAKDKYSKMQKAFESLGIRAEDMIVIAGNHDDYSVMSDVLSEYMITKEGLKEIKGVKFAAPLKESTGMFLPQEYAGNFLFNDDNALNKKQFMMHMDKVKEMINYFHDRGIMFTCDEIFETISERFLVDSQIDEFSKSIENGGLKPKKSYLSTFYKDEFLPKWEEHKKSLESGIDVLNCNNADYILTHGQIDNIDYSGVKEFGFFESLAKQKKREYSVLHGHIHSQNSHINPFAPNIEHYNPGGKFKHGIYVLNDSNQIIGGSFFDATKDDKSELIVSDVSNFEDLSFKQLDEPKTEHGLLRYEKLISGIKK